MKDQEKNNRKLNHDSLHEANHYFFYLIFPMAIYIISFKIKYIWIAIHDWESNIPHCNYRKNHGIDTLGKLGNRKRIID